MIRSGRADAAVAGSTEGVITAYVVDGHCQLRALSTRNDDPQGASRPFSLDRDGFVVAEGSGILILEELEHARRRGATILAELVGYGASGDGYHITAPHPDDPQQQTYLYGDWGAIVGEEFIFLQDDMIKLPFFVYQNSGARFDHNTFTSHKID